MWSSASKCRKYASAIELRGAGVNLQARQLRGAGPTHVGHNADNLFPLVVHDLDVLADGVLVGPESSAEIG